MSSSSSHFQQAQYQDAPHNNPLASVIALVPREILARILSGLDGISLSSCTQVSREWHDIASHSLVWKHACLSNTHWNIHRAVSHLKNPPWRKLFIMYYCRERGKCPGCLGPCLTHVQKHDYQQVSRSRIHSNHGRDPHVVDAEHEEQEEESQAQANRLRVHHYMPLQVDMIATTLPRTIVSTHTGAARRQSNDAESSFSTRRQGPVVASTVVTTASHEISSTSPPWTTNHLEKIVDYADMNSLPMCYYFAKTKSPLRVTHLLAMNI